MVVPLLKFLGSTLAGARYVFPSLEHLKISLLDVTRIRAFIEVA